MEPRGYRWSWYLRGFGFIMNLNAMKMLIHFLDGRRKPAVLLAASGDAVRVAIPGCDDSIEFRLRAGHWWSETYDPVNIEFSCLVVPDVHTVSRRWLN